MKTSQAVTAVLFLAGVSAAQPMSAAERLPVINSKFANVPVECMGGYALQAIGRGNCASYYPQQAFNGVPGMGWEFSYLYNSAVGSGAGLTRPNTAFNPPPFTGLPFGQAAYLQNDLSGVAQSIFGFTAGRLYRLSFWLGSRYASGSFDGNQTVLALVDGRPVGSWSLVSFTPFTLRTEVFGVTTSGAHVLKFIGTSSGDHTAFLSGVTVEALEE